MSPRLTGKLQESFAFLKQVFFHSKYYQEAILASLASRASMLLLCFRGSGKTHLMECIMKTIDPTIQATQQGYLSADIDDVFARPSLAQLAKSDKEVIIWKRITRAHIKGFDEIQRLGPAALSAMFKLLSSGKIQYLEEEFGSNPCWIVATSNPMECESISDSLRIHLPEPLLDRFDGVLWVPVTGLFNQLLIDYIHSLESRPAQLTWSLEDLQEMWGECDSLRISENMNLFITLANRILGFCQHAQGYDASSIEPVKKKALCSKCNASYLCSRILRPPSVRAKLALQRLARGFCYLRGGTEVELIDVEKAFPLAYWCRIAFMDEDVTIDRLKKLRELFAMLHTEILEAREAFKLFENLKECYDETQYRRLHDYRNSKVWLDELLSALTEHYNCEAESLRQLMRKARREKDPATLTKISLLASNKFPSNIAYEFHFEGEIPIPLTKENLERIRTLLPASFKEAKDALNRGASHYPIKPPDNLRWVVGQKIPESFEKEESNQGSRGSEL